MTSSRGRGRLEKTLPPLPFPTAGAFSESLQLRRKSMGKVFYLIEDADQKRRQCAVLGCRVYESFLRCHYLDLDVSHALFAI